MPARRSEFLSPSWLIVGASLLFALMGACVKLASAQYGSGEIVMYRGLAGALIIGAVSRWRGDSLRTKVPAQHLLRGLTGVVALCLWFYALGELQLATAMTLNYTSSLWLALFLLGGLGLQRRRAGDRVLAGVAVVGFIGVVLILRPTVDQHQTGPGIAGLLSGMVSATGYLQVATLARKGEPESRIVFYFSVASIVGGAALSTFTGWHGHSSSSLVWLLSVGILSTFAQLMLTSAYARGRTLVNASLQYLGIAFSFLLGVLLFDERVTWIAGLGMVLVVGAGVRATALRAAPEPSSSLAPDKRRTASPPIHTDPTE
jgi:S-adenosylmethionine uptake transporter